MIQSSNVLERAMALAMSRACVDFSPPPSITPSPTGFTSPKFPKETFFKRAIKRALVVTSFSFENQTSNSGSRLISIIITSTVFVINVSYRIHLGNAFPAPLNGYKSFTTMYEVLHIRSGRQCYDAFRRVWFVTTPWRCKRLLQ